MPTPDHDRLRALAARTGRMLPEPVHVRPPGEERSLRIRATRGCGWNACGYCHLYRASVSGTRPLAEVLDDLDLARALYGPAATTVFFGDADLLALDPADAATLMRRTRAVFPGAERLSAYVTPSSAVRWAGAALAALAQGGLHRVYADLDTSATRLHALVQRPDTPAAHREGLRALKTAGFEVWVGVLLGLGGDRYSREHIAETTACLNAVRPDVVNVRTLACAEGQPLTRPVREGRLELAWAGAEPSPIQTPLGTLDELRELLAGLTIETEVVCDHASNFLPQVRGHLPNHRQALRDTIDSAASRLRAQKRPLPIRLIG